jgi:hypothetical protein
MKWTAAIVAAFVAELNVSDHEVRRLFDNVRDDGLDATNRPEQPSPKARCRGGGSFILWRR